MHAGNSGRLLEMLHGSDGWEKLALQLQQREEEEAKQHQQQQEEEAQQHLQQKQPSESRKRGRTQGSDPDAGFVRSGTLSHHLRMLVQLACPDFSARCLQTSLCPLGRTMRTCDVDMLSWAQHARRMHTPTCQCSVCTSAAGRASISTHLISFRYTDVAVVFGTV